VNGVQFNISKLYHYILNEKRKIVSTNKKNIRFDKNNFRVIYLEFGPSGDPRFIYLKL
jgi:hypothetical protein